MTDSEAIRLLNRIARFTTISHSVRHEGRYWGERFEDDHWGFVYVLAERCEAADRQPFFKASL